MRAAAPCWRPAVPGNPGTDAHRLCARARARLRHHPCPLLPLLGLVRAASVVTVPEAPAAASMHWAGGCFPPTRGPGPCPGWRRVTSGGHSAGACSHVQAGARMRVMLCCRGICMPWAEQSSRGYTYTHPTIRLHNPGHPGECAHSPTCRVHLPSHPIPCCPMPPAVPLHPDDD